MRDYSIDEINKAIRNNLFNRVADLALVPKEESLFTFTDGKETVLIPTNTKAKAESNIPSYEHIWSK